VLRALSRTDTSSLLADEGNREFVTFLPPDRNVIEQGIHTAQQKVKPDVEHDYSLTGESKTHSTRVHQFLADGIGDEPVRIFLI
jgi:hypothetical protein